MLCLALVLGALASAVSVSHARERFAPRDLSSPTDNTPSGIYHTNGSSDNSTTTTNNNNLNLCGTSTFAYDTFTEVDEWPTLSDCWVLAMVMQTDLADGWWQVGSAANENKFIRLDSYMTCQFGIRLGHHNTIDENSDSSRAANLTVGKQDAMDLINHALVYLYKADGEYKTAPRVSGFGTMTCRVPGGRGESHALDWVIRAIFDQ